MRTREEFEAVTDSAKAHLECALDDVSALIAEVNGLRSYLQDAIQALRICSVADAVVKDPILLRTVESTLRRLPERP